VPLTAKRILDFTPGKIKARTRVCSIRIIGQGKYKNSRKLGKVYELKYYVRCLDGNRRVTLRYVGNKKPGINRREQEDPEPNLNTQLWASCGCPWHMYVCEYSLAKQSSSDIIYSNGQPPVIKNPHMIGWCCKHVVLAIQKSIKDWKFARNRPKKTPAPSPPARTVLKPVKEKPIPAKPEKKPELKPTTAPARRTPTLKKPVRESLQPKKPTGPKTPGGPKKPIDSNRTPTMRKPIRTPLVRDDEDDNG